MTTPMFERQHYVAIAKVLWELRDMLPEEQLFATTEKFIGLFGNDNPNFNPSRFWNAVYDDQKPPEL